MDTVAIEFHDERAPTLIMNASGKDVPSSECAALAAACSDLRVKIGVYNTIQDARDGGAIAAGWIPDGLPAGVTDLRYGYLPDGRQWGVFTFPREGEAAVRAIAPAEITTGPLTCDPPGRLEWWPQIVRSPVDVERVRATGFRLYSGSGRAWVINWGQGRAYYWK